ncbi:uncharacterized protein N7500_008948 [Penicillium coprophilum]|uniref:uncharacterized protein n=1 Tax=Penicillium coprophilum TaxID=36646 RepID=UPI00238824BE|nr:uncharacterized protein N7500_008948 [Penicillium coprophilum]KAJ5159297.1 hypothetical protein N7500_008948 [Penicillium coprophilum]
MGLQIYQNKVYVIYRGRVDQPTIYSSWGHAHPKVTGFDGADFRSFERLEDAQNSLKEKGIEDYKTFLKPAKSSPSQKSRQKYYAVAYGTKVGVFRDWK